MSRLLSLLISFAIPGLIAPAIDAAPIVYSQTLTASGTLNGAGFSNAVVVFTQTADTANVLLIPGPQPFRSVQAITSTVSIAGFGVVSFTVPTFVAVDTVTGFTGLGLGPANVGGFAIVGVQDLGLRTYDLRTAIGPVSFAAILNPFDTFATSGGALRFGTATGLATFVAVPEPSGLALIGVAVLVYLGRGTFKGSGRGTRQTGCLSDID